MSWRVVIITGRCKLEYRLGYLVCRGEQLKKVFLDEIDTLIVESTAAAMTSALLCELIKAKVNVVFCDEKHNPHSQLVALNGRHDASRCLKRQICWGEAARSAVWTAIVRLKIERQTDFLRRLGSEQHKLLEEYAENIAPNDGTNREGHAAKVYFDALFGLSFKRGDKNFINGALNYGYAVLLSAFSREIVANGFVTRLGIAHKNDFNAFNLSCDLMEPFRVLVDMHVFDTAKELTPEYKHSLCNILNQMVVIAGEKHTVSDAVSMYCRSVFEALECGDPQKIKCYEL